jgi:medium-chain acyl-[acyl-carrier-protein] hydrolase
VQNEVVISPLKPAAPAASPWLHWQRPNPAASLRLFCFPYAGGGATVYRGWAAGLPSTVEVCAIQPPGREARLRETPMSRISALVPAIADALLPHLRQPFAFYGHSMGALVSFELSRLLRREHGLQPSQLFVSAKSAPQLPPLEPPIHSLPEPEFVERLRELNGTPQQVLEHRELMQVMFPILRADFTACETYVYADDDPFDFPITVYGGLQDAKIPRDRLDAWRAHTNAAFAVRMFPGDHFFIHQQQPQLLRTLHADLHQLTSIPPPLSARGVTL